MQRNPVKLLPVLWGVLLGSIDGVQGQPTALGPEINTDLFDESAPLLSADGSQLFFWSSGREDGLGIQDIYYTQKDTTGRFLPAQHLGAPLNDPDCNIALAVTPDGNRLLVYRLNRTPGYSDLALARKYPQGWGPPTPIKIEGFESSGAGLTAYLAADGRTLLLSTTSEQGSGREDLLVSFYAPETRKWSVPLNLGPTLNTSGAEVTPFLAPDGITLYFSSTGHSGLGGDDVFMTRRLDDSWTRWSPPQNLGLRINTPGNDYYFKFAATDPTTGYLVSDHGRTSRDILQVAVPPEFRPQPVLEVVGNVYDRDAHLPLPATIRYTDLATGADIGTALTDTVTGTYRILLPAGRRIGFVAEAPRYLAISENLTSSVAAGKPTERKTLNLTLVRLREGQTIALNNLFFPIAGAQLQKESAPELQRLAALLLRYPDMQIEISGHTDNTGTDAVNLPLSEARAAAVAANLRGQGIPERQLQVKGYGSSQPVAKNDSPEGRRQNRRVEITLLQFPY